MKKKVLKLKNIFFIFIIMSLIITQFSVVNAAKENFKESLDAQYNNYKNSGQKSLEKWLGDSNNLMGVYSTAYDGGEYATIDSEDIDGLSDEQYEFFRDAVLYANTKNSAFQQAIGNEQNAETALKAVNNVLSGSNKFQKEPDDVKNILKEGEDAADQSADISKGEGETEALREPAKIYKQPTKQAKDDSYDDGLEQSMTDADEFIENGSNDKLDLQDFQTQFGDIYNIVLQIGVGLAVIVGIVLGVKFILSSVEGKAEVKKMLITYVVSCVVIFGSFGIWKIVVTILQTV